MRLKITDPYQYFPTDVNIFKCVAVKVSLKFDIKKII